MLKDDFKKVSSHQEFIAQVIYNHCKDRASILKKLSKLIDKGVQFSTIYHVLPCEGFMMDGKYISMHSFRLMQ